VKKGKEPEEISPCHCGQSEAAIRNPLFFAACCAPCPFACAQNYSAQYIPTCKSEKFHLYLRMEKIFLLGYMGSGKTTIGKRLAKKLNQPFIDLDIFIENRYHKTISEIFAEKGEPGFRETEKMLLREVAQFESAVIATGGGTPCFFDNMTVMNESGLTIYLKTSVEKLSKRLNTSKEKRPIIKDKNIEELKVFISENLEKREPYYNRAIYTYNVEQLNNYEDIDVVVNHLARYLSEEK
jgi:shikimate kinase